MASSSSLAERLAKTALAHYENALPPQKGKPKDNEWTVYAAILASRPRELRLPNGPFREDGVWVVSSATGTKCTADRSDVGYILHDCHAEVLCRRGLMRVLWKEIRELRQSNSNKRRQQTRLLIQEIPGNSDNQPSKQAMYQLKPDLRLHLYISDSPCGDASIYPVIQSTESGKEVVQYTGAKVIVGERTQVSINDCGGHDQILPGGILARESDQQVLGKLRTKSGRSNVQNRSFSMSCSDKILRWSLLGLQGSILSLYIPDPIRLDSIVVGQDPRVPSSRKQLDALRRAIPDRVSTAKETLLQGLHKENPHLLNWIKQIRSPEVFIDPLAFDRGKASLEAVKTPISGRKRKRDGADETTTPIKYSPSGLSVCWQQPVDGGDREQVEIVVGARGIKQGKIPKSPRDFDKLKSSLSRHEFVRLAKDCQLMPENLSAMVATSAYSLIKAQWCSVPDEEQAQRLNPMMLRTLLFQKGPLSGWIVGNGTVP